MFVYVVTCGSDDDGGGVSGVELCVNIQCTYVVCVVVSGDGVIVTVVVHVACGDGCVMYY